MIKGIDGKLKPFLSKIILNDPKEMDLNKKSQYSYYYGSETEDTSIRMLATMQFCIKSMLKTGLNPNRLSKISNTLESSTLNIIIINDKQEFSNFFALTIEEKLNFLKKNSTKVLKRKLLYSRKNINKYIFRAHQDKKASSTKILNVPLDVTTKINFNENTDSSGGNPNFLGCIYFLSMGTAISGDTIGTEVIFNNNQIYTKTGYFIIGDSYGYNKKEFSLTKTNTIPSAESRLLTVFPGLSNIAIDTSEQNINQKANEIFGSPGDIWTGPIHFHRISDPANPNFGKSRAMAGAKHSSQTPHPYLTYIAKPNTKIVDFRSSSMFEDLFSYKSLNYEAILATSNDVTYTGQKTNIPVDNFITNKPVFSEGKFSVRPVVKSYVNGIQNTKDNISFFFALDKKSLLTQTTKLSNLLQKLTAVEENIFNRLVTNLNINYFEIIRVDKATGESKSLLVGDNDIFFSDANSLNQLGKNISKGFSLTNRTNELFIENFNSGDHISFYEFVDGELDAKNDNGKFCYEVKLKFRDPMLEYLSDKLIQINNIIQNVDELTEKSSFLMRDSGTGRLVKVFDEFQQSLNNTFVSESLDSSTNATLPLSFTFDRTQEIPTTVAGAFTETFGLDDLNLFFVAINSLFCESFNSSATQKSILDLQPKNDFTFFVKSALRLSSTNPTLLEKVNSLMKISYNKVSKLLDVYSSVNSMTKKSSGFTTKDSLKSTDINLHESHITEFNYKFDNIIDLTKSKNYFNWIEEAKNFSTNGGIKEISSAAYKSIVQNPNIINFLTTEGRAQFAQEGDFDYSFLPYASPSSLNLQKAVNIDLYVNYLQTIQKQLFSNINNSQDSVLVPEILSNFGVRFISPKESKKIYLMESTTYSSEEIPLNNALEDNFGSEFADKLITTQESFSDCGTDEGVATRDISFGSVGKTSFSWQGGTYKNYPINFSLAFINLLLTDSYKKRNINFLNKEKQGVPEDVGLPFSINLFSLDQMSNLQSAKSFLTNIMENIYDTNGNLKFYNYHYYAYLLSIFSRVYYLRGFEVKSNESFGISYSLSSKFLPTTTVSDKFIKKMDWVPLSLSVLQSIPQGKKLFCKVEFFEDDTETCLFDKKIINLYKNYFNYNHLFYINTKSTPANVDLATSLNSDITSQPREIQRETITSMARQKLDKQIKTLNATIDDKAKESAMKSTAVEDAAYKENLKVQQNTVKVIQKRE
tara:strand:- start:999 stop:4619 length:3621 start_codon:yes stop_codon:yes gene_type:complete